MASPWIDLHAHSTASDGTLPPAELVRLASRNNLSALALTDHDTINGLAEAAAEAKTLGIDFLPGIEISAEFPHPGTLHLLGYGIDPNSGVLRDLTTTLLEGRDNRNPKIIEKLQSLNVAITMEEVEQEASRKASETTAPAGSPAAPPRDAAAVDAKKAQVIGRPHIAAILVRKGYVTSIKHAFDKYLAPGGLAYFDKERLSPRKAIELVRQSGGLPVLAHPFQLRTENDGQLDRVVKDLVDLGLAGIEVIHSDHDDAWVDKCNKLADRYNLLKTGGSDFHGSNKKDINLGIARGRKIPRAYFDSLIERLGNSRQSPLSSC